MDVVVLGSLNMDLVAQVSRLPKPGETVLGDRFTTIPGGKGANQAVAAARLKVKTAMIGRVGSGSFGKTLCEGLVADGIDISAVSVSDRTPSGTALIAVAPQDNQIIVVPGANGEVGQDALTALTQYIKVAKVLLLQFEIPLPVVEAAAAIAHTAGLIVVVDPAPAQGSLSDKFCRHISILTPNQTEAGLLTGVDVVDRESAIAAAQILHQQGAQAVIIKLGELGSVCVTAEGAFSTPAFSIKATDTVAAGDAFNGGLAAALCQADVAKKGELSHDVLKRAITYASAVSAIAVTRSGAQPAMPTKSEVETFLSTR